MPEQTLAELGPADFPIDWWGDLRGIVDHGDLRAFDASAGLYYRLGINSRGELCAYKGDGSLERMVPLALTVPFTWATGDRIVRVSGTPTSTVDVYPVDSVREGWFEAVCSICDESTSGNEAVVEEWADDHAATHQASI